MTSAISVGGLTIRFGGLIAVNNVSFEAEPLKITSVIGPNGAGKSTLFNLISGAFRPSAGSVRLFDKDITGQSPQRLLKAGLSRSFQITNLFFESTVFENLRFASQIAEPFLNQILPSSRSRVALTRAEELLERFDLQEKAREQAGALSHGEQRRLEIAVALAGRPKVLLLDEPTQGMSHRDTAETAEMIKGLAGEITVLLIEHDIGLVMTLSDHIIVMHQGAKLADGKPEKVRADAAVQAAYLGHA